MDRKKVARELLALAKELTASEKSARHRLTDHTAGEMTPKQKKYREFFEGKLRKYKVNSPSELNAEQKKKFFDEVDKGWDAEKEED